MRIPEPARFGKPVSTSTKSTCSGTSSRATTAAMSRCSCGHARGSSGTERMSRRGSHLTDLCTAPHRDVYRWPMLAPPPAPRRVPVPSSTSSSCCLGDRSHPTRGPARVMREPGDNPPPNQPAVPTFCLSVRWRGKHRPSRSAFVRRILTTLQ